MDTTKNPFSPGAGTQPPELSGREENLERARVVLARIKDGRSERSVLLYGLRGVGKTVLLNRIHKIANETGYFALLIEAPEDKKLAELLVPPLRQILLRLDQVEGNKESLYRALNALRTFASIFHVQIGDIGVGIEPQIGVADSGYLDQDLSDLFEAVGEAARESKTAIAVLIDELQYVKATELAALLTAIHRVGQRGLPFVIFGAGLPQLARLTGEAKSYAERLFEFNEIGALNDTDAEKAIRLPIEKEHAHISQEGLDEIVRLAEGYPYFLQEWGSHSWNVSPESPITKSDVTRATTKVIKTLDDGFFKVRFDRLTPAEKNYMRAMAELGKGPHRSADIAQKLERPIQQLAPMRSSIITKGMIYGPSHGDTAFTVPKFDEYLRRVIPNFEPKKTRGREEKKPY